MGVVARPVMLSPAVLELVEIRAPVLGSVFVAPEEHGHGRERLAADKFTMPASMFDRVARDGVRHINILSQHGQLNFTGIQRASGVSTDPRGHQVRATGDTGEMDVRWERTIEPVILVGAQVGTARLYHSQG